MEISLGRQDAVAANTMITNCTVRLLHPNDVTISCSTFTDSTIKVNGKCKRNWNGCYYDSCVFRGSYFDHYFGNDCSFCPGRGGLRNCDFTNAKLDLCGFINCKADDLRLPGWPHVAIFHPRENAADFAELSIDPLLRFLHESMKNSSEEIVASIWNLPAHLKRSRKSILNLWEIQTIFAKAKGESAPPEPVFDLDRSRDLLKLKNYVHL